MGSAPSAGQLLVRKDRCNLLRSDARFRALFDNARDCIIIKDRSLTYTDVHMAMARLFHRPAGPVEVNLPRVFEPCSAAPGRGRRAGLGLLISRNLVEAMGGV